MCTNSSGVLIRRTKCIIVKLWTLKKVDVLQGGFQYLDSYNLSNNLETCLMFCSRWRCLSWATTSARICSYVPADTSSSRTSSCAPDTTPVAETPARYAEHARVNGYPVKEGLSVYLPRDSFTHMRCYVFNVHCFSPNNPKGSQILLNRSQANGQKAREKSHLVKHRVIIRK